MKLIEYLQQYSEETPQWLLNYRPGDKVSFKDFMSGRVGYYPYSQLDGSFMKLGNRSQSVHCFLYVDDTVTKGEFVAILKSPGINGYHQVGMCDWNMKDICPNGPHPLDSSLSIQDFLSRKGPVGDEFCSLVVFERDSNQPEECGANRFAVAFLKSDPIAAYYQLFAKEYKKVPWLFMLSSFRDMVDSKELGRGKLLHRILESSNQWPEYVIADNRWIIWPPYNEEEVEPFCRTHQHSNEKYYLYHLIFGERDSKKFHCFDASTKKNDNWGNSNVDKLVIENNVLVESSEDISGHVDIPQSVVEIRDHVFWRRSITSVNIPNSVLLIGFRCFGETPIKCVEIPEGVNYIDGKLFFESRIERVQLPEGVTDIRDFAFADCDKLKEINIPLNLKRIGIHSFRGCRLLKKLVFPDGLKEISENAFLDCTGLEEVSIPREAKVSKDAFEGCKAKIVVR